MVESAVVAKAFVANDIDNKNQWTINEVHILKNNNIKENILLLECAISQEYLDKSNHA